MSTTAVDEPKDLMPRGVGGRDLRLVVVLAFILNVILVFPEFTPGLSDIGNFDEARYITQGSSIAARGFPTLSDYPVPTLFYALIYLPVRGSDFWFVYTCAIGRFFLFSLLWISSYLLARKISRISSPLIMVGLLLVSPASVMLIREGGHALFTAVSAFGLSQFLCFYRYRTLKDLWTASTLLGVSLLCRFGEGTFLIIPFIALSALMGIWDKRLRETLTAAMIPCVAIVSGYMLTYYSFIGKSPFGASSYFYLSFEEGHGRAYQDKYPGLNFYVEGALEARQLFGTREENHGSVINAIRRNPTAYLNRIPRLARSVALIALGVYGGPLSLWFFLLVLQGLIELIKRREFMLMGILLSSLSYLLIYVLLVVREPYLLIPFPILFCLACIGTSSIGSVSRNQRYAWSALLAILFVVSFVGNKSLGMMFSPLVLLTTLWIIWLILKRYGDLYPVAATTIVLLFGMMSLFGQHASSERLKNLGTGPAEQAFVFLRRNFAENANMAAYSPNIPRAARMTWLDLTGIDTRAELRSDEDLQRWMNSNKVAGFYVDDLLRRFEPSLWALIENQIGKTSTIAFSSETPYIQILRVNAK